MHGLIGPISTLHSIMCAEDNILGTLFAYLKKFQRVKGSGPHRSSILLAYTECIADKIHSECALIWKVKTSWLLWLNVGGRWMLFIQDSWIKLFLKGNFWAGT